MRAAIILFISALLGSAAFIFIELREIRLEQRRIQAGHGKLEATYENLRHSSEDRHQKLQEKFIELAAQIEKTGAELSKLAMQQEEAKKISEKLSLFEPFLLGQIDENAARQAAAPLPFSYFRTEEWKMKREDIAKRMHAAGIVWVTFEGHGSETALESPEIAGSIRADGVFLRSFEIFNLKNNLPNTLYILAPGLAYLDYSVLTVKGDRGLDKIILDGCLKWEKTESEPAADFVNWRASDINGRGGKSVRILTGISTQMQDKCDHRYLLPYENILAAQRLLNTDGSNIISMTGGASILFQLPQTPFGGIGMSFRHDDHPKEGHRLVVISVLNGKPAQQAGLAVSDTITKIDGLHIKEIDPDDVLDMLRGEVGSKVVITYIPAGGSSEDARDITLERAPISAADFSQPEPEGKSSAE